MKKLLLTMAVAMTAFVSCNKAENNTTEQDPTKSTVNLTLVYDNDNATRSEQAIVGAEVPTAGPGHIFFVDGAGLITRHIKIVAGAAGNDDEVSAGSLGAVASTIKDVPNNTTKCCILMNSPLTIAFPKTGTAMADITALTHTVAQLEDAVTPGGGVKKVPLYGEGVVTNTTNPMTVNVQILPQASRLQVKKISGITDVVSFKVEGIFINNYFATMPISKVVVATDIKENGQTVTKYVGGSAEYPATLPLWDYAAAGIGNALAVNSYGPTTAAYAWAYNIFPNEHLATAATMPMIVVRLKDVVWNDGGVHKTLPNPAFITVRGMKDGGTSLTKVEARKVYTFNDIQFERKHVTSQPVVTVVDADVTVQMMPWVPITVTPEY